MVPVGLLGMKKRKKTSKEKRLLQFLHYYNSQNILCDIDAIITMASEVL